jgi:hypothetical protein
VAGAILSGEFVIGTFRGSDFEAMADRGVKLFDRGINANAFGGIDTVADGGVAASRNCFRTVEVQNLKTIASQHVDGTARVLGFFLRRLFLRLARIVPAREEDPAIVSYAENDSDGEKRQNAPEQTRDRQDLTTCSGGQACAAQQAIYRIHEGMQGERLGKCHEAARHFVFL